MVELTQREADVARLRDEEGMSWNAIAKALGVSKSSRFVSVWVRLL